MRRGDLPSGTVTFLFTDVEGSTRLLHSLGAEGYADALAEHRRLIREACAAHDGVEVDTQGDAFFFAFPTAPGAVAAASTMTEALAKGPIQVRVGLHTGIPLLTNEGYVGDDVHFAARVAASGHGGQVVVSSTTAVLIEPSGSEPQALSLVNLGEHRLKDIAEPVSIFQLGDGSFPPLKTISNTNLPHPASSFVGREKELAQVPALIEAGARLVTLTGPGGTGKTRLAIEAAASLVPAYKAGVFWIGLAALKDPALVTETIAQTLGAKDGLAEHIAERELLLLLDNLEQVIEAAPELSQLLRACPNLALLVTSRELLRIQGEVEYPVPPLAEPEAVSLFCARSQLEPTEEISELCAQLDNLPLAVELAAARTKALSVAQILERLSSRLDLLKGGRDADPRQQTLRATIEWSYELLSAEEQQLFARLSVFAGGCTLEAAEDVCDADLDTLQSLVEKSLLRFTASKAGSRYWLLETIREYAEEQVERNFDSIALRLRHAGWCCDLVDRLVGSLGRFGGDEGFGGLHEDSDNVRSALAWAWRSGENEYGLRLGAACRFWMWQGFFHDAVSWLDAAVPRIPLASLSVQLGALEAAGQIAFFVLADSERADEYWARAQAIAEELGAAEELAWIESKRAGVVWERGDLRLALTLHERVLAYHRASGDRLRQADSLHDLGEVFRDLGRFEEAKVALVEADAIFREHGLDHFVANNTHSLADLALDRDDCDAAVVLYREGLEVVRRRGDQRLVAYCVAGIASVMAEQGRDEVSATLWGAACAAEEQLGFRMLPAERRRYSSRLARLEGTAAWSAGRELTLQEALVSILPP